MKKRRLIHLGIHTRRCPVSLSFPRNRTGRGGKPVQF